MVSGAAGHAIPPFKERLREALESESLPVALGRSLPQLSERRDAAFRVRDFEGSQADLGGRRQAAREEQAHVYYGDVTSPEALAHAHLGQARVLALLINDPPAARRAIAAARAESPDVPIPTRTRHVAERDSLLALGANHVVCEELEGGTEMSARVLKSLGLDAPAIRTEISRALAASESAGLTGAMDEWIEATDKQR